MNKGAIFSKSGRHRYYLWRRWADMGDATLWIMLNPSTADAERDDATIRRCVNFTKAWGCTRMVVVNLFALRATDPRELKTVDKPIGANNDAVIKHQATNCGFKYVVAAWGNHGKLFNRQQEVAALLGDVPLVCLGVTKSGCPKHPLRLSKKTALRPFGIVSDCGQKKDGD